MDSNQRSHFASLVRSGSQSASCFAAACMTCCSLRLRLAYSATGGASAPRPIDVNDVLCRAGRFFKLSDQGTRSRKALKIKAQQELYHELSFFIKGYTQGYTDFSCTLRRVPYTLWPAMRRTCGLSGSLPIRKRTRYARFHLREQTASG